MSLPRLDLNSQPSDYQTKNFEGLKEFLRKQSPLLNFKFLELTFTTLGVQRVAHNLGFQPKDIILTSRIGDAGVEFMYANFSATELEVTITGAATPQNPTVIRFFAGHYQSEVR